MELDWLKIAVDLGSFGMVAWLVFYTFSKMLPEWSQQFRTELAQEREVTATGLKDVSDAVDRLSKLLILHDASVRGKEDVDPDTLLELLGKASRSK